MPALDFLLAWYVRSFLARVIHAQQPVQKLVEDVPPSFRLGCMYSFECIALYSVIKNVLAGMNNTDNPVTQICTVADLCGFGGTSSFIISPIQLT